MREEVVIYCRVSTDEQAQHGVSLEDQLTTCRAYAAQLGWPIAEEYVDSESAAVKPTKREDYLRMVEDARAHKFGRILVKFWNRFGRNEAEAFARLEELELLGIDVQSLSEPGSDRFVRGIHILQAAEFSRKLSQVVLPNMKLRASQGFHMGRAPFGYTKPSPGRLEIDPITGPLVAQMFEMYIAGIMGARGLGVWLRQQGCGGTAYTPAYVLRNPVYCGTLRFGGTVQSKFARWRKTKPEEQVLVPGAIPAIISAEVFEQAQERLKRNVRRSFTYAPKYLLAGLLTCGECGRAYCSHPSRNHKGHGYRCRGAELRGHPVHQVNGSTLERWVMSQVGMVAQRAADLSTKDVAEELARRRGADPTAALVASLDRAIAKDEQRRKALGYQLLDGTVDKALYMQLNREITARLENQRAQRAACHAPTQVLPVAEVLEALRGVPGLLEQATIAEKRETLNLMIEQVVIRGRTQADWEIVWREPYREIVDALVC